MYTLSFLRRIALLLTAASVLVSSNAFAQGEPDDSTRAAARSLGTQGIEAYWANDYDTASTKLDRAFKLYATATLGLWSARAREKLGQLVAAAERYREALRATGQGDAEAQQKALKEARSELDALQPRIPTLTVHVNARAEDVSVTVDNARLPSALLDESRPTDPGSHFVVAVRGSERQQIEVRLREGEQRQLTIQFRGQPVAAAEPVPGSGESLTLTPLTAAPVANGGAAPPAATRGGTSPLKPLGIITMAFGGAALATAGVTALIANDKRADCTPENVCTPDIKQSYDSLRTVSTVSFYAGMGLAVGGLVMWLVAPNDDAQPAAAVSFSAGPTGVALSGAF